MLATRAFEAAQHFIQKNARNLENARFQYHFGGASPAPVINALKKYQNTDGGFGHALEPDLRSSDSSALCTSIAFQIIRSIKSPVGEDFILPMISYLLDSLNVKTGCWRIIPPSSEKSPHAPWWNQKNREETFDAFSLNPAAEILGYLYNYQQLVPKDVITFVTDKVTEHLFSLKEIEMHELLCCLRLLQTKTMPPETGKLIQDKLTQLIDGTIAVDPAQWQAYSLRPLQVADHPDSPFIKGIEGAVEANISYEISSQNHDGSWTPTWTWGDAYPDDWMIAQQEWAGIITLEKLLLLKNFNYIK